MRIAVEGCAHGELETIYDTIKVLEERESISIDLLICCGDFQSTRNEQDLHCMAIPSKYYNLCSFYKYYTGVKEAPILTIFIGGNHEASNYLQELPYGGWVAPNIYYLGYGNVINIAGVRIGGISGIYKGHDYLKGHFEKSPYDENTKRSVYHIRSLEVFRLKQVSQQIDIFLSHDWPTGICSHGNVAQLIRKKRFLKDDIESGKLGSKPCEDLLNLLKPTYWFAAHLHCKFAALVCHPDEKKTKFLALDKCLPHRNFLQVLEIPHNLNSKIEISYDIEWLTILYLTNHLLSVKRNYQFMPGPGSPERWQFTPSQEEKAVVLTKFENNLVVPNNFVKTAEGHSQQSSKKLLRNQPNAQRNPQTVLFCEKLGLYDPIDILLQLTGNKNLSATSIDLNDSANLSSFINDSTGSDTSSEVEYDTGEESTLHSSTQSNSNRLMMFLPQPKHDNSNTSNDSVVGFLSELNTSETKDAVLDERSCLDNSLTDVDESVLNETNTSEDLDLSRKSFDVISNESPMPKKFKRRNASIYNNEET